MTGLETVVADALEGKTEADATVEEDLDSVLDLLDSLVKKKIATGLKITVGQPLRRKDFSMNVWKRVANFWKMKRDLMKSSDDPAIVYLPLDLQGCSLLEDGIHLSDEGAKTYFERIFYHSGRAFASSPELDVTKSDHGSDSEQSVSQSPLSTLRNARKRNRSPTSSQAEKQSKQRKEN